MSTITTAEAAELAGIQPQTIRRYCRQERFKCLGSLERRWVIDKRSFMAWLKLPRKCGKRARKPAE